MTELITPAVIGIIIIFFIYFCYEASKLYRTAKIIKKAAEADDVLAKVSGGQLKSVCSSYSASIKIDTCEGKKTNLSAIDFFNDVSVGKAFSFNMRMLDAASGVLVGLGLLGTFFGLTIGIKGFNTSTTSDIQTSIQGLLDGMDTAFITSLVGMGLSLVYTVFIDKPNRKELQRALVLLDDKLDDLYYVDDYKLIAFNQQVQFEKMTEALCKSLEANASKIIDEIKDQMSYISDSGEQASVSNAIRVILRENEEQSKALKSFSTDLALQLNDGFDQILSQQMQQRIVPLMENVDATTKAIVEHIDQMAAMVSAPASDMLQNVVSELKDIMTSIVEEFNASLSGSATGELERLALSLGTATQAMGEFPKNMADTSTALQNSIEQMKAVLEKTVANASTSMHDTINQITQNVANSQADLIALQDTTTSKTERLLKTLGEGIERLESINESVASTLTKYLQVQGQISGATSHLQTITSDMETASQLFAKSQSEYNAKIAELQTKSQTSISAIEELLGHSGALSAEYAQKFEVIRQGLAGIFSQLQTGLNEYSRTVRDNTQKYLDQYSTSLTATTDKLSSTISQQNEVVEMLVASLDKQRRS